MYQINANLVLDLLLDNGKCIAFFCFIDALCYPKTVVYIIAFEIDCSEINIP